MVLEILPQTGTPYCPERVIVTETQCPFGNCLTSRHTVVKMPMVEKYVGLLMNNSRLMQRVTADGVNTTGIYGS